MELFLLALLVMLVVVAIMAVGVIFGRQPIKGSCGGIPAALGERPEDYVCPVCGDDPAKCDAEDAPAQSGARGAFYDASSTEVEDEKR